MSEVSPKSVVIVSVTLTLVLLVTAINVPPLMLVASISIIMYSMVIPMDTFIVLTLSNIVVVVLAVNVTWLDCRYAFSRVNVLPSNVKFA